MIYVAIGGFFGAILRYLIGLLMMRNFPTPPFPIAMVFVNLLGSFGLGLILSFLSTYNEGAPLLLLLGVGFFGAFTTFSTFSMEAFGLLQKKMFIQLIFYLLSSIVGSILMFSIGYVLI